MRSPPVLLLFAACSFHPGAAPDDGRPVDGAAVDVAPQVDGPSPDAVMPATCADQITDGDETAVDCGGSCAPCGVGLTCAINADCLAAVCDTGVCRYAAHCSELHQTHAELGDGSYTIDPDRAGAAAPFATSCDMTVDGGGWTLVGKVDGRSTMHTTWLVSAVNPAALQTTTIDAGTYACVDAVYLAVNGSTEVRFSNAARTAWVKWPLPAGRTEATWWRHSAGQAAINGATQSAVTVTTSSGITSACFQNVYGIMPFDMHGGAYPYAAKNTAGNTSGSDSCMAVGTMLAGATADGFTQNGNGFDAPSDEITWPNTAYNVIPHVAVWLR